MSVQITIIGLGQVGTSIGLALAGQKNIKRVGHDKDNEAARQAQKAGAVDEIKLNLPSSVSEANVIILSMPLSEIRETLGYIAQGLQDGAVIIDTAPAKATVAAWVKELIPQGRHYIGLTPAAGAEYLHGVEFGVASARADLFRNGLFLVNALHGTPESALKLALNLIEMLGARAMLSDEIEADGLLASTHILPQLIAAALIDSTMDQPGWREAGRLAARPYATVTAGLAYHDDAKSLSLATFGNRENVARILDAYMLSLKELRDKIKDSDEETVATFLEDAFQARIRWFDERHQADWDGAQAQNSEIPSTGSLLNQMFFGNLTARSKKSK